VVDKREEKVLPDDVHCCFTQLARPYDTRQITFDERDSATFDSHIRPRSHSDTNVCLRQSGSIVDAIAGHGDHSPLSLKSLHDLGLFLRQNFSFKFIDAQLAGNGLRRQTTVPGEHDYMQAL